LKLSNGTAALQNMYGDIENRAAPQRPLQIVQWKFGVIADCELYQPNY
jgi:hypothetical protein